MTRMPEIWIDMRDETQLPALTALAPEVTLDGVVARPAALPAIPAVQRMVRAAYVDCVTQLPAAPADTMVIGGDERMLRDAKNRGRATAWWVRIEDADSMEAACERGGAFDALIVELADPTNIPLELLLARFQGTRTRVIKCVETLDDARIACGVLESGCDGVMVRPDAFHILPAFDSWRRQDVAEPMTLKPAEVIDVRSCGMGMRVCVDTVDLLGAEDAMVVGSTAAGGVLVCAEVHPLPYMKLRPFRVNAGALHSYLAAPDRRTAYLSELAAGDEVTVVSASGVARSVVVGRAKMEQRPLLLIIARCGDATIKVALQNDWHVRIFDGERRVRSITTIRPGDTILGCRWDGARHVGIGVREHLWEA